MALTISNRWTPYEGTVSQQVHTLSAVAIGAAGPLRKAVAWVAVDNTATLSSMTFNGAAMTLVVSKVNTSNASIQAYQYRYDIPDALAEGTYDVVATMSASTPNNVTIGGCQLLGAALGAAEDTDTFERADTEAAALEVILSCTVGAAIVAVAQNGSAVPTWAWTNAVTERNDNDESNYSSTSADDVQGAAGDKTVTATSSSTSGQRVLVAASYAAASGPTIDTQPTAQIARINGEAAPTATFTVAATTSGGTLLYDWELEDGVASGVYANLADGDGATWTGQTAASCVGTFTAITLSGRRLRCNVTDDNGTVTTDAVALSVFAGPVTTASSSSTNGSGVGTLTYTSDDALTTNGECLLWTVVAGRTGNTSTFYVTTRPSTP